MGFTTAVVTSDDLFRDINAEFMSAYRGVLERSSKLPNCMKLGVSSNKRTEYYGYYESPPTIDRVKLGDAIAEDAFRAIAYSVTNIKWGKALGFLEEDLEDIQLGDLRQVGNLLGKRAGQIPEEVFFQILTGAASARLLENIPTAPDGASLYSTTAGGAARFGVVGGNVVTGTGVASPTAVRADFWNVIERFRTMQDTEGQPLLSDGVVDGGVTIVYNVTNEEVMREAFLQGRTSIGANTATSNAAVTNTILESGLPVTLWSTQRLTDNDMFVFVNGDVEGPKPVFEQIRRSPRMIDETRENSERARWRGILSTIADMRSGFGVNIPYLTCQINN
jgi:hypothetical protein